MYSKENLLYVYIYPFFFFRFFFQIGHYRVFSRASCSMGFPGGSDDKESACSAGNWGLIPGSGSPGEGNGNPPILVWKIPWTEEPDRLQSVRLQSRTRLSDFTFFLLLSCSIP